MADGGNAIEAAIVAAAVLGVVEPFASGIGGGFMVVHIASTGEEFVIDSDVTAHRLAAEGGKRRLHPGRRAGELSRLSDSGAASVRALLGIWVRSSQFDNLK